MKTLWIFIILSITTGSLFAQSGYRVRLADHPTVKGNIEAETETDLLIRDERGNLMAVPKNKIRSKKPYQTYREAPGYDQNRNDFYLGLEWGYNQTFGQEKQNFFGYTIFGRAGYDWDHRYAMEIKTGFNNMNFTGMLLNNDSSRELYIPIILSVKKYLTRNRNLLYLSLGHGYSWGIGRINLGKGYGHPSEDHNRRGAGPVVIPGIGIRRIGKYGQDYELQIGVHLQQMNSRNINPEELNSELEISYRRWNISYGMMF